jgi:Dynamin family
MTTSQARTSESPRHVPGHALNSYAPLSAPRIGAELETCRKKLIGLATELSLAAPSQLAVYLDGTAGVLNRLQCRVAVIGQVKAGKSTFINAFIQRPGLLPTNVNPWTTAVTHVHFIPDGVPAGCAARFTFFSKDEWARIIHGGGLLRELTERFVPGFGVDLLQQHVNAMRRRCEQRLGSEFGDLFGTSRDFETINPDILSEYICAGQFEDHSGASRAGRYSDVVKSADLYIDNSTFCFPAQFIDTPGTNDPLLVRDEITRQSLAEADIHIIILSARQALGSADVELLQILHGLNKKNVILFVNRIDELSNVGHETKQIVEDVRRRLGKAFPHADMKIIAGSAHWAQLACKTPSVDVALPTWRKAQAYAAELGLHSIPLPSDSRFSSTVLLQASGMPQVYNAVSELMIEARSGHTIRQVRAAINEITQISAPILVRSINELIDEANGEGSREQQCQNELREIEQAVHQSEKLLHLVHCVQIDAQARTNDMITGEIDCMSDLLYQEIDGFIREECAALRSAIASESKTQIWICSPERLRRTLHDIFLDQVTEAENKLLKLETVVIEHLQAVIEKLQPNLNLERLTLGSMGTPMVSAKALRKTIALDLGEPWWKGWWRGGKDGFARAVELENLIRSELDPIVNELRTTAHEHLIACQLAGLKSVTGLGVSILEMLRESSAARYERIKTLKEEQRPMKIIERSQARARDIAALRERIEMIEKLSQELSGIDELLGTQNV